MQHSNRLGALWIAGVDINPGDGVAPRVYIGTAFGKLSSAGVNYFERVAESVGGTNGIVEATGSDMLKGCCGFFLALHLGDQEASDGVARVIAVEFLDRLRERLENISDPEFIEGLLREDTMFSLPAVMAFSSSDLDPGINSPYD